jgi:crossover junction endodeoxyribonuclease RuvC
MAVFIGIDPGQKGAIGCIFPLTAQVHDMPEFIGFDLYWMLRHIQIKDKNIFCILEAAQAMPKQGVTGVFSYGVGYGKIKAVLEILKISFQEVHPAKWKKEFSLIGKDKKDSVKVAKQLFPYLDYETERGRLLDGRAEAMLLAEYGRRLYEKEKR